MLEIGAGVLPVGIQEQRIEPAVEIVVMRDIAPRPCRHIELLQPPVEEAHPPLQPRPAGRHAVGGLAENDREQIRDRALLHPQRAVHVGFAEPNLGIEQHAALGGFGHEIDCDRRAGTVADSENGAARRGEPQGPPAHESPEQQLQQPVHRPHPSCLSGPVTVSPGRARSASGQNKAVRIGILDQIPRFWVMRDNRARPASLSRNYRLRIGFAFDLRHCGRLGVDRCRK